MLNFLLFVSCYLGGFFLAITANPVWAFMVYQIVYFMNPMERWWGYMLPELPYSLLAVMLMGFMLVKDFKNLNSNRLLAAPQFKWIYLIALAYIVASFYAVIPSENTFGTINFIKLVVIVSIAYKLVDTDKKLEAILAAYIAGAAYIGFLAFQVGRNSGDRVEGIGTVDAPDANGIAAAIVPAIVLCLYYFWVSRNKLVKLGAAVAGAFIANGIVLINSRGAFLATLASVAYFILYLLFSRHQRKYQKASAIGVIVLGLMAGAFLVDESAMERFHSMREEKMTEEQQTGATRIFFWMAALKMSVDHPFGAGYMGFEAYAPNYLPQDIDTGFSRHRSVHSSWLQALTEVGYHGFFFLVMMLLACFNATRRCKQLLSETNAIDAYYRIVAIEAGFIAYIVAMSFMNRFLAEIFYWFVMFTACAYNVHVLKNQKEGQVWQRRRQPYRPRRRPKVTATASR